MLEWMRACVSAMEELICQAAQGEVLHNDDTSMLVLALRRSLGRGTDEDDAPERTGVFTSGIVSTAQKQTIALFFTGRQHAGENLSDVLQQRAAELAPPMQMCDALSRNLPKLPEKLEVIVGHCLAHARRRFVEVTPNFPEPCRHVLEQLGTIYGYDAAVRQQAMTPDERLRFHQQHSASVMAELRAWLTAQFAEKKVEPNSGLGMAMRYLLKHWERLTLFLRRSGAPLDNNICYAASGIGNVVVDFQAAVIAVTGQRQPQSECWLAALSSRQTLQHHSQHLYVSATFNPYSSLRQLNLDGVCRLRRNRGCITATSSHHRRRFRTLGNLHRQQSRSRLHFPSQQSSLIQAAPMKHLVRINSMRSRHPRYRRSRSQRLFHYSPTLGDTPPSSLRLRHNRSTRRYCASHFRSRTLHLSPRGHDYTCPDSEHLLLLIHFPDGQTVRLRTTGFQLPTS
jgi:hypothetical protein